MTIVAALLFGLAVGQATTLTPARAAKIARRRAQPLEMRPPPSATSRVRRWTVAQRRCEKRRKRACIMLAPDLVQAEADKPRE